MNCDSSSHHTGTGSMSPFPCPDHTIGVNCRFPKQCISHFILTELIHPNRIPQKSRGSQYSSQTEPEFVPIYNSNKVMLLRSCSCGSHFWEGHNFHSSALSRNHWISSQQLQPHHTHGTPKIKHSESGYEKQNVNIPPLWPWQ